METIPSAQKSDVQRMLSGAHGNYPCALDFSTEHAELTVVSIHLIIF